LWFELPTGWQAKAKVDLTASLAMRGAEGPTSHTDRFNLFLQILYRFNVLHKDIPGNDGYVIGGLDFRGGTGYRGAIGGGAQLVGTRAGCLALSMFQFTWGKGVRNPISERLAGKFSGTPDILWQVLGALDPVLGADGCVYSDPKPEQPSFKMFCIGSPDAKDASQILLPSRKRVPVGTHLWIFGRKLVLNDGTAVAEIPWLQHLRDKAGNAVEELGHCLKTYGAEALIMAGNVAAGCAVGGIEGVIPFSDGLAMPSFYAPGRDYTISEGICETATAALSLLVGWGELNATLRGGALVAPRLALATGRGTMAARSTAATLELVNHCAKTGYLLANGSNIGPGTKKVEEAAARDTETQSPGQVQTPNRQTPVQGGGKDDLAKAARQPDRNGLTSAGRALQKHGMRPGSAYSFSSQKANVLNKEGQEIVEDILTNPGSTFTNKTAVLNGEQVKVLDVIAPDGRGVRFTGDGKQLIGFREP
ncbi:hypothetical protein, partial [Haliangium sp. UPWRP_2]|uniref:hypothetical protein n=1 Tax=Haliangium sp. UPWRP_2 TaxID=1931276 RepID=UPI001304EFD1